MWRWIVIVIIIVKNTRVRVDSLGGGTVVSSNVSKNAGVRIHPTTATTARPNTAATTGSIAKNTRVYIGTGIATAAIAIPTEVVPNKVLLAASSNHG